MTLKTYPAIYENGRLVWVSSDRPVERRVRVMVTVMDWAEADDEAEHTEWTTLSLDQLAAAFGEDEPEYLPDDVKFR